MSLRPAIRIRIPYFLAAFLFSVFCAMPMLPRQIFAEQSLQATQFYLGLIPAAGAITFTLMCPLMGHLATRWNRRLMLVVSPFTLAILTAAIPWCARPWQLAVLSAVMGAMSAGLWPPLELQIGEGITSSTMVRVLGIFNVCWSSGMCVGMLVSGALYDLAPALPFLVAAGLAAVGAVLVWCAPGMDRRETEARDASTAADSRFSTARAETFVWIGWIGNLGLTLSAATLRAFFPRLGLSMDFSPTLITLIVPAMQAGQLVMFFYLSTHGGWRYRIRLLLGMQCVTCLATLAICVGRHPGLFLIVFFLIGLASGFAYASSLHYSLSSDPAKRGFRAGVHEGVLGAGLSLGPLLGGMAGAVAERAPAGSLLSQPEVAIRVPFWTAAGSVFLVLCLQAMVYLRMTRRAKSPTPTAEGRDRGA